MFYDSIKRNQSKDVFPIQILPNNVTNGICNPWHGILANITGWLDLQQCYLVQKTLKTRSLTSCQITYRNSHPEVFLGKAAQNICSKFTGELPCRSVIFKKLQSRGGGRVEVN